MAKWLLKTEPDAYSFEDLKRDKRTTWDGVTNALAVSNLLDMRKGDAAFVYHTGKEKRIVGIAEIVTNPTPDPKNEKSVIVDIKPRQQLANPVTLKDIKADERFKEFALVRISRLSVMPVPEKLWNALLKMADSA